MPPPSRFLPVLALLSAACGPGETPPRTLRLEGLRPRHAEGLFLNEELVLTFSRPVDPLSVTTESLSIRSPGGHRARGEWRIQGRTLRFVPAPVLRPDLRDGGYLPGTRYVLEGVGFPHLDGLWGTGGEPLERGFRFGFTTAEVRVDPRGVVFDDASPERSHPLLWHPDQVELRRGALLRPWEPLLLACAEPLDPSSLVPGDFELTALETRQVHHTGRFETEVVKRSVPVFPVMRSNHPEGSRGELPCCEIELYPRDPLTPGDYVLTLLPILNLTDFHGNPVRRGFSSLRVRVEATAPEPDQRRPTLPFLDRAERAPLHVPGTDGVASWEAGRVTVRYPAAAGNGESGSIEPRFPRIAPIFAVTLLAEPDVHATRVDVPAGDVLTLAPGRGLRVLRAQRRIDLEGALTRTIGPDVVPRGPAEGEDPFRPEETLSEWLARAGEEDWDWTVIVAGGDLSVPGRLEVDTPLLLVAGGWIRAAGTVRHAPRQLWLMGDGGGVQDRTASFPDLILDPPRRNLLREPLRVAVVSTPVPSAVRPYRWLGADARGEDGAGSWSVGFLPPVGPVDPAAAVGHPRLLTEPGPLRVLIELEVPSADEQAEAGGDRAWDPPLVDYVDLRWEDT